MSQFIFLCLIYFTGTNTSSLLITRIKSWDIIKLFPSIFKNTSQGRLDILVTHYIAGCFGNLHFSNLSKNRLSADWQNIVYCYWLHIKRDKKKTEEVVRNLFKKRRVTSDSIYHQNTIAWASGRKKLTPLEYFLPG